MTREQVCAVFLLAGIEVQRLTQIDNQYWPKVPEYQKIRDLEPWWLVETEAGVIEIGWRKRVLAIDWSDTAIRKHATPDQVTKSDSMVHASSFGKAVEYLSNVARSFPSRAKAA